MVIFHTEQGAVVRMERTLRGMVLVCAIVAASLASADEATAATSTRDCDGCSVQAMDQMAYDYANGLQMPADDTLYILNWSGNIARKYRTMRDREGGAICDKLPPGSFECEPFVIVDALPVEQQATDFLLYRRITAQGDVQLTDPKYPSTAFDDVSNPQKRQAIDELLAFRFETYVYLASGAYSLGINVFAPVKVNYSDGSQAAYSYNLQTQRWEPNSLLYKDRFGNSIPLSITQLSEGRGGVTHRFEFPGGSAADIGSFVNALNNLGISVSGGSANPGSSSVVCTSFANINQVSVTCNWGN